SAYCPDLPGVAATGAGIDECAAEMRDAIAFHIEGLHDAGEPVPPLDQPRTNGRSRRLMAVVGNHAADRGFAADMLDLAPW
ncbi:MAG: type II toxin-antitoxin system HicB family antitoxin, partial [Pseudonocardiaceae bacterium]